MKNTLVAAPLFFATLSYGYDFSPNDRLALGTPFRDIEQVFSECKEAYVITNELGDVADGMALISFNQKDFWDSAMVDIQNAKVAAVSYVNAIHPFFSSNQVQNVLDSLIRKYGTPVDKFYLYTFGNQGPLFSPAYGWDSENGYIVFAHSLFCETPHGTPFTCQMTVMRSRRDISKYYDFSDNILLEGERAAKIASSGKNSMTLPDTNERLGRTPLMVAAMHGDLDKVKSLLQKGADVVETDKTGFTLIDILREYLRRIEAIQPEAKADYADKIEQSGFLEKDVRRLLRIADEATRDLPKEKSQIEALKQILTFIETSISHKFEVQYCAWKKWVANHPLASTYTTNEPFFAIVNLGVSAIPLIVEKIETNKDDFHLGSAIGLIAKRKFGRDEWPEGKLGDSIAASEMYVKWWKYGRHKTEMRFEELLSEWHHSVTKGNAHKTQEILREISDLGIPVLPYLVVQLNENPELIPVFLYLSEAPLELPASAKDCVQWWNENKANFEVLWRGDQ
ncbi:MAG: hypothetical protein IKO40_12120 [Kiritimatiellae bacterium]|nr:hypothetical protein [Kiritimatiellia bacterium]